MITKENILRHEMIGLKTTVCNSTDPKNKDIEGKIIDETQKTFRIKNDKKIMIIQKKGNIFQIELPDGTLTKITGDKIITRPEERIQKRYK